MSEVAAKLEILNQEYEETLSEAKELEESKLRYEERAQSLKELLSKHESEVEVLTTNLQNIKKSSDPSQNGDELRAAIDDLEKALQVRDRFRAEFRETSDHALQSAQRKAKMEAKANQLAECMKEFAEKS